MFSVATTERLGRATQMSLEERYNSQALMSPEASIIHALADPVPTSIPTNFFFTEVSYCQQGNQNPTTKYNRDVSRVPPDREMKSENK